MEPYSADDIKRKKRRYPKFERGRRSWPIKTLAPSKLIFQTNDPIYNIYDGTEKMVFKKRNIHYQEIFQNEFGQED